jgi:hypothetical protein
MEFFIIFFSYIMIIHKITTIGLFSSAVFVDCLVSNAASVVNIGSGSGSNNNSRKMIARNIRGDSSTINNSGMLKASGNHNSNSATNSGRVLAASGSHEGGITINKGGVLKASGNRNSNSAINSGRMLRADGSSATNDNEILSASGRGSSQRILPSSKSSIMK